MQDQLQHTITGDKIVIDILTNRFTHDLVNDIKNTYPFRMMFDYKEVEFNLRKVKMIDSSSIGFLFELHNKLHVNNEKSNLVISVGDNKELKDLLHKFQVDLLLNVK